ncbi:hypothetical protein GCM10023223_52130 [Stackebrandtia albiflava]
MCQTRASGRSETRSGSLTLVGGRPCTDDLPGGDQATGTLPPFRSPGTACPGRRRGASHQSQVAAVACRNGVSRDGLSAVRDSRSRAEDVPPEFAEPMDGVGVHSGAERG